MMIGRVLVPPMVTSDCQCAPVAPSTGDKEESASAGFNRGKWESRPRGSTHLPSTRGRSETPGSKEANVKARERRTLALTSSAYTTIHGPLNPNLPLRPPIPAPTQNATPLPNQLPNRRAQERERRCPTSLPTSLPRRKQRPSPPPSSPTEQETRLGRVRARSHLHAAPGSLPGSCGRGSCCCRRDAVRDGRWPAWPKNWPHSPQSTGRSNGLQRRMLRHAHRRRKTPQRSRSNRKRKTRPPPLHQLLPPSRRRPPLALKTRPEQTSPRPSRPARSRGNLSPPLAHHHHHYGRESQLCHSSHVPLGRPRGPPHQPTAHGRAGVRGDVVWGQIPPAFV